VEKTPKEWSYVRCIIVPNDNDINYWSFFKVTMIVYTMIKNDPCDNVHW